MNRYKTEQQKAADALLSALETAWRGLRWYRDQHPESVDASDYEADEKIALAIENYKNELAFPTLDEVDPPEFCRRLNDQLKAKGLILVTFKDAEDPALTNVAYNIYQVGDFNVARAASRLISEIAERRLQGGEP